MTTATAAGQLESGAHDFQREPAYPDDPYAYQDGYEDEPEMSPKRRGGLVTIAAVLALAVVGTGAAFAYRTYIGSPRSGDPPIIKADNGESPGNDNQEQALRPELQKNLRKEGKAPSPAADNHYAAANRLRASCSSPGVADADFLC